MRKLFALIAIFSVTVACQSQPEPEADSPIEEESAVEEALDDEAADGEGATDDDEETIAEEDEKVNDDNGLGDEGSGGDRKCPPAADPDPDQMCAQVITYGLTKEGRCCQYPNPCVVPDEIVDQFTSLDECRTAAGKME